MRRGLRLLHIATFTSNRDIVGLVRPEQVNELEC